MGPSSSALGDLHMARYVRLVLTLWSDNINESKIAVGHGGMKSIPILNHFGPSDNEL